MPKGRRITGADIKFVSLCPRGMNGLRTLYKSDGDGQGSVTLQPIIKAGDDFMEKGQLVAAVWVPNRQDREGDWADAATVEKMAHSFARNGMQVDLRHDERALTKDEVFVAESFVIQKGDPRFANLTDYDGTEVDATGGWGAVFQIESPELRKEYREGKWGGVSMAGPALVVDEEPPASARFTKMAAALDGDDEMKPEEMKKALDDSNTALLAGMKAMFTEAGILKTEDDEPKKSTAKKEAPTFTGDLNDPAAIRKHLAEVELANIDTSDPAALAKHAETLEAASKSDDGDEGDDKNKSPELRKAERELAASQERVRKLQGKSNQPAEGAGQEDEIEKGSDKFLKKCHDTGTALAKFINGDRS